MDYTYLQLPEGWDTWEPEERIGSGASGTVFKLRKRGYPEERCALKIITIPSEEENNEYDISGIKDLNTKKEYLLDVVRDYRREIELMEALKQCPYVVRIIDHAVMETPGCLEWKIYIFMELLTPLDRFLEENELKEPDIIKLGQDICSALIECENRHILHRDIKPSNILRTEDGIYKLGDFGISRLLDRTMGTLSKKGTNAFMAPEVYKGQKYGKQADLYSLGIVLYRLLNHNRDPFIPPDKKLVYFRDREEALAKRMSGEKLPPLSGVSEGLARIIYCACEYRSEKRFPDAAHMKDAFMHINKRRPAAWVFRLISKKCIFLLLLLLLTAGFCGSVLYRRLYGRGIPSEIRKLMNPEPAINSLDELLSCAAVYAVSDEERFEKLFRNTDKDTIENYRIAFQKASNYKKLLSEEIGEVNGTVMCSVVLYNPSTNANGKIDKYSFLLYAAHIDSGWVIDNDREKKEEVYAQTQKRGLYPSGMSNTNGNNIHFDPYNFLYMDQDKVFEDSFTAQTLYLWQDTAGKVSVMVWYANGTDKEILVSDIHIPFVDEKLGVIVELDEAVSELIQPQKSIYKIYEIEAENVLSGTQIWTEVTPVIEDGSLVWSFNV